MERGIRQLKPIIKLDLYPPTNWTYQIQAADHVLGSYVKNRLNDSISKYIYTYKRPSPLSTVGNIKEGGSHTVSYY